MSKPAKMWRNDESSLQKCGNQGLGRAMADNTQELDDILNVLYMQGEDIGKLEYGSATHQITAVNGAKQAVLDWHKKQVLEIIGEDDTVFLPGFNGRKYDVLVRNKLRAEQRNKLKESK